jgi:hypothetical protein
MNRLGTIHEGGPGDWLRAAAVSVLWCGGGWWVVSGEGGRVGEACCLREQWIVDSSIWRSRVKK